MTGYVRAALVMLACTMFAARAGLAVERVLPPVSGAPRVE